MNCLGGITPNSSDQAEVRQTYQTEIRQTSYQTEARQTDPTEIRQTSVAITLELKSYLNLHIQSSKRSRFDCSSASYKNAKIKYPWEYLDKVAVV